MKPKLKHFVYLVHWPEINVMKAGYTAFNRWRVFTARGAVMVDLIEFDNSSDAFEFEDLVHRGMARRGPQAFTCATDAVPWLGAGGGGYLECYRLPDGLTPMELLTSTNWLEV